MIRQTGYYTIDRDALLAEIIRCKQGLEANPADRWWAEDLSRVEHALHMLEKKPKAWIEMTATGAYGVSMLATLFPGYSTCFSKTWKTKAMAKRAAVAGGYTLLEGACPKPRPPQKVIDAYHQKDARHEAIRHLAEELDIPYVEIARGVDSLITKGLVRFAE